MTINITNLGSACKQAQVQAYYTISNGVPHALIEFQDPTGKSYSYLIDFNLNTGIGYVIDLRRKGQVSSSNNETNFWLNPDKNLMYIGMGHADSGAVHPGLISYNLITRQVSCTELPFDPYNLKMDAAGTVVAIGGGFGHLATYNVANGTVTDHGELDPPDPLPPTKGWRILRYVWPVGDYVYCMMNDREVGKDYVIIVKISTSETKVLRKILDGILLRQVNRRILREAHAALQTDRLYTPKGWRAKARGLVWKYCGF